MRSLSLQFLKFLSRLRAGEECKYSQVGRSWDIDKFCDCGAITRTKKGRGYKLTGDSALIASVLNTHWSIPDIDKAILVMESSESTKGDRGLHAGHTKAGRGENSEERRIRVRAASAVSVILKARVNDIEIPRLEGVTIGLPSFQWDQVQTMGTERLVAVICENIENFHRFDQIIGKALLGRACPILVFWRSHKQIPISEFLVKLRIPEVFYFCDFDLAGVFIYEKEILPIHPEAKLVVPESLSAMIELKGNPILYNQQIRKYRHFKPMTEMGRKVADAVRLHRKSLEQETVASWLLSLQ